jgi:hypothetical protein
LEDSRKDEKLKKNLCIFIISAQALKRFQEDDSLSLKIHIPSARVFLYPGVVNPSPIRADSLRGEGEQLARGKLPH